MATGNSFKTDLYDLYHYSQNSFISYPKQLFIETLREFFGMDSYYGHRNDRWGFPLTTDHTNELPEAGLYDDSSTRLFIGEVYRFDVIFYPAIFVKHAGARSVPISMNRDKGQVQWENILFEDGYGNQKIIKQPAYYIRNGAWEGTINVDIEARSPLARDELVELVAILFVDARFDEMKDSGVVIKPGTSIGGPSESEDRTTKIFKQSISFEYRYEWHRQIPIKNVIDIINVCFDIGNLQTQTFAPNLAIQFQIPSA